MGPAFPPHSVVAGGTFLLQDTRKDRYRAATATLRHVFSEDAQV
jgi:hypothetical protein